MSAEFSETKVLAIASHVVSGHVGNKIAVFVLQSMGFDVSALNTVQFSNHTGYRQWRGTRATAQEITDLWEGLKQSYLDRFDMMLSGYIPGLDAVEAVGEIARELRDKARADFGRFFWALDPVMGDNGRLYVADEVVPAYRRLVHSADLILPNQFEAELLSEVKITDCSSLRRAVRVLHSKSMLPHIVITSVSLPLGPDDSAQGQGQGQEKGQQSAGSRTMSVVGSTRRSDGSPRLFRIAFPVLDCYFSGTGDMFAALMVARLREAVDAAPAAPGLRHTPGWLSPDDVDALELPLARAAELVLASMHGVLGRTCESMERELRREADRLGGLGEEGEAEAEAGRERRLHLLKSRAAELKLVGNLGCLKDPVIVHRAEKFEGE